MKHKVLNITYKILISWVLPLLVATTFFVVAKTTLAQIVGGSAGLSEFLASNNLEIGDEIGENGFRQIYYIWQGNKHFITNTAYTNGEADTEGEYIAWMGQSANGGWQIFLYHIPTDITTQLFGSSNNANPKVSGGKVVWEGWVEDKWQIFFFDGTKVTQLTYGDLSLNPEIEGDFVSYGRKDTAETWRGVVYSISKKEEKEIIVGIEAQRPIIRGNEIFLAGTGVEEIFPLTVDDLFLLDLMPLTQPTSPEMVTEEKIRQELEATPSAEISTPL